MIERLDEAPSPDDPSRFEPQTCKLTPHPIDAQLSTCVMNFGESGIIFIELGKKPEVLDTMLNPAVP